MPKDGARNSKSDALVPCLLHFKRLRWFIEFDRKWTLEGHPKASKINELGTSGSFFEIFGVSGRADVLVIFVSIICLRRIVESRGFGRLCVRMGRDEPKAREALSAIDLLFVKKIYIYIYIYIYVLF
jgi:hypothetical protein